MKTTARTITTILGGAALLLATAGVAGAQESTPDPANKQTQTQAKKMNGGSKSTATRNGQAAKKSKATRKGRGGSGSTGSGNGVLTRSRARNLSSSGTRGCTGSGGGSRRGTGGGGSGRGGHR